MARTSQERRKLHDSWFAFKVIKTGYRIVLLSQIFFKNKHGVMNDTSIIFSQIIITSPDEPPFSDAVRVLNSVIIAADTQEEYDALIALRARCGDSGVGAVKRFKRMFVSSDLPALSRFRGIVLPSPFVIDGAEGALCIGEGSGQYIF
jgi:hypothetical protein